MPELPEVEVTRRGIVAHLTETLAASVQTPAATHASLSPIPSQIVLTDLVVRADQLRWPVPKAELTGLPGQRLLSVARRGKYLLFDFGLGWLIVHLGMSGTLRWTTPGSPLQRHDHIDLVFGEKLLRFNDPRRFGAMLWHDRVRGSVLDHPLLASLGLEPDDPSFTGTLMHRATRGRSLAIKQILLSGRPVVGVGNIYASEALFKAGILPTVAAGDLTLDRCERLADAVRQTLAQAIEQGGSTLRDFFAADGKAGYFQLQAQVYGREGQPCRCCGQSIRSLKQQQRASFFCPHCQH